MAISMLKIRRPLGRLIFNMGIAIPGKTVFLIETAPRGGELRARSRIAVTQIEYFYWSNFLYVFAERRTIQNAKQNASALS